MINDEFRDKNGDFRIRGRLKTWGVANINGLVFKKGSYSQFLDEYYTKFNRKPPLCYNHDINDVIGVVDEIVCDSVGMDVYARIFGERMTQLLWRHITDGTLGGLSDTSRVFFDESGKVERTELLEVSIVHTPADPLANFTVYKPYKLGFLKDE